MEKMKEELYRELHIVKKYDKEIIIDLISKYSNWLMYNYNELKAVVKTRYKQLKLNNAIELSKRNITIFINDFMITNFTFGVDKVIGIDYNTVPTLDIIINGVVEFSIHVERITSIETISEVLYKE